jgi:tRNA/tmRNA/rRNA uracil-C5-methylase (TrmA/RlmC/RlmD family)
LCPAIAADYHAELSAKNDAFREFWKRRRLSGEVRPIVASPKPRRYRTVSKRRVFERGQTLLGLTDFTGTRGMQPLNVQDCPIEPEEHNDIYRTAQGVLFRSRALASALNYVVVKGSYDDLTVILSVHRNDSRVRAACNLMSKELTRKFPAIRSVFAVQDEATSYYLSDKAERLTRLYGRKDIETTIGELNFRHSPLSFSQTNHSVLPAFVAEIKRLIDPQPSDRIWDLYCGWGLLGLSLAPAVASVAGMDVSAPSVESARSTARGQRRSRVRFVKNSVTPVSLNEFFNRVGPADKVILDPPRAGTAPGVIEYLAMKKPKSVVHVFCNVETMPDELAQWDRRGYEIQEAVPVDMFPATEHLEVVVLLKGKSG